MNKIFRLAIALFFIFPHIPSFADQSAKDKSAYFVQVASHRDRSMAVKLVKRIQSDTITPLIDVADLKERGMWNRVIIGGFQTKEEANGFIQANDLKKYFPDCIVKKIDLDKLNLYKFEPDPVN